jgi:hypothetical protein
VRWAAIGLQVVLSGLCAGACVPPREPTVWSAKGQYREVNACLYDAFKAHRKDLPWDEDDQNVTIKIEESESGRRAHVIVEKYYPGPIIYHTMRHYDVVSIQDGPDRVRVERYGKLYGLDRRGDDAIDMVFADCHLTQS